MLYPLTLLTLEQLCMQDCEVDWLAHFSVATRKEPCIDKPAPPPMTMPSSRATTGFLSTASWYTREYSVRKNLLAKRGI